MRVLFAHDTRFLVDDANNVYCETGLTQQALSRYLAYFEELVVFARCSTTSVEFVKQASLTPICDPRIKFVFADSLAGVVSRLRSHAKVRTVLGNLIGDVDAVIVRLPSEFGLMAAALAHKARRPMAVEVVTCAFDALWNHGDPRGRIYAPIFAWRVRRAVRRARFVIYVSKTFLPRRYPTSGELHVASNVEISTGDHAIAFVSDVDVSTVGASSIECKAATETFATLSVGTIGSLRTKAKGLRTAIQAIACCRKRGIAVELRVLGGGDAEPWREMAVKLGISQYVHFDGVRQGGKDVFEWLGALDLYIQPSFQEGLPRALVEAMSVGVPALGSTAGGIPELLPPAQTHAPGDWRGLASLIERATKNVEWRRQLSKRGLAVATEYDKEALTAKRDQFWWKFAGHARQAGNQAAPSFNAAKSAVR